LNSGYLTRFIKQFKESDRKIYLLILTHLYPGYFKNFYFSKQKVYYLEGPQSSPDRKVEKIIINRDDPLIKDEISNKFLHHNPMSISLMSEFQQLQLDSSLSDSSAFNQYIEGEFDNYLNHQNFDPISVCCAIRCKIEKLAFNQLNPPDQIQFLDKKNTIKKLVFAVESGAVVPEIHFLLGILHNSHLHMRESVDNFTPILSKLNNITIRKMIESL